MYNERSDRDAYHKTPKDNYVCASYRRKTTSCTIHFIRTEIVRDLILDALRNVATYARANKEDFEQLVMQTTSDARRRSLQSGRTELDRIMRRTNELDTLLQKLYEDYALGCLPENRHAKLSARRQPQRLRCRSAPLRLFGCHQCRNRRQYRVRRFFPQFGFRSLQRPYQSFFVSGQVKALILLIASGNVQCSSVGSPALLLQQKGSVCRTQQTIRAGDQIEFILCLLLAGVMNKQQANAVFIGKRFQFSDNFIIAGIAVCISTGFADFLQCVDDNKSGIWVFLHKPFKLFFQTGT